ncbi:serine/threonine-protein kinase [Aliterella atlantica]|uniref:Serine/threonine protein kinase n=1 Tax=Aliterella atlantica CENA595 TaxID=1618023 RepID=A0A0D8ZTH6_9CYAN|nr:serine/threonine-protein kinase [Aliterella atlantica]KJH71759.1 serine/threonine protein kinase [Aliterella atlantica CENA595]
MLGKLLQGRYQIIGILSAGGFCQTYLAKDIAIADSPTCVVKHLKYSAQSSISLPSLSELLDREAEALKKLGKYDRVPQLLAHFEEKQEYYLVQELIEGYPLTDELNPEQLWSEHQVIYFLQEVLTILEYIHSHGLIHRDIKPSNLIRRRHDNKLVLIDFGAVKQAWTQVITEGGKTSTKFAFGVAATIAIGTPGYTPPEQERGIPRPNSDIYALGAIAIQALTGLAPTQLLEDNNTGEILWRHYREVSPRLAEIISKMVRYHFKERYQSATEVKQDLQLLLKPQIPQIATIPTKVVTKQNYSRQLYNSKVAIAMVAGVALVLTAIAGGYYLLKPTAPASEQKQYSLFTTNRHSPFAKIFLAKTLSAHSQPVWSTAISANGQILASGSQDNTIKVWAINSQQPIYTLLGHKDTVRSLAISADGRILASGSGDTTVKLWNLQTGKQFGTLQGHNSPVWSIAMKRDGQTLVSACEDGTINIWNLRTGALREIKAAHSSRIFSVALSPDEQTIATGSKDKTIKIWHLPTGKLIRTINGHTNAVRDVLFNPNGKELVSASWDKTIKVWDWQTGKQLLVLKGHSDRIVSVTFSANGQNLVSASIDKTIKIWDIHTGKMLQSLPGHSDWVLSLVSDPTGQTLVSSSKDKTIKIWQREM